MKCALANTADDEDKEKVEMDKEELEELIDRRVEKRVQEELDKRENNETNSEQDTENQDNSISRRNFLKKLGAGAIGLGALSLSPASALNIRSDNLEFFSGPDTSVSDFSVDSAGNIGLSGSDIHGVSQIDGSSGNHRIRFDSSSSWLEFTDQSNSRSDIVTNDVYLDSTSTGWLSNIEDSSSNSIDADTVDGSHASELGSSKAAVVYPVVTGSTVGNSTKMNVHESGSIYVEAGQKQSNHGVSATPVWRKNGNFLVSNGSGTTVNVSSGDTLTASSLRQSGTYETNVYGSTATTTVYAKNYWTG